MNTPSVCVLIVSYNSRLHLPRCIASLLRQSYRDFEIDIVDNGSSDGTVEALAEALGPLPPTVRLLWSPENLGFAKANNWAASSTNAHWLATLTPTRFPNQIGSSG